LVKSETSELEAANQRKNERKREREMKQSNQKKFGCWLLTEKTNHTGFLRAGLFLVQGDQVILDGRKFLLAAFFFTFQTIFQIWEGK
jgi:hypothetical protein